MKKISLIKMLLVAMAILAIWGLAFAVNPGRPMGPGIEETGMMSGPPFLDMLRELNLSEDQMAQVKAILDKYREDHQAGLANMMRARIEIEQFLFAETTDEEMLRAAHRKVCAQAENDLLLRAKMVAELKTVLYPEQVEQIRNLLNDRMTGIEQGVQHPPDFSETGPFVSPES